MAFSHTLAALTQSVVLGAWIRRRASSDNLGLSVIAHKATAYPAADSRRFPVHEQLRHLVVRGVAGVRHFEPAFGDDDALPGRHRIDRDQFGGRAAIAGDDSFAPMASTKRDNEDLACNILTRITLSENTRISPAWLIIKDNTLADRVLYLFIVFTRRITTIKQVSRMRFCARCFQYVRANVGQRWSCCPTYEATPLDQYSRRSEPKAINGSAGLLDHAARWMKYFVSVTLLMFSCAVKRVGPTLKRYAAIKSRRA